MDTVLYLWIIFFCIRESRATIIRDLNSLGRCLGIHALSVTPACHSTCATSESSRLGVVYPRLMRHSPLSPRVIKVGHSCLPPYHFATRLMSEPPMDRVSRTNFGPFSSSAELNQFFHGTLHLLCNAHDVVVMVT